jgi:glycosyltransferase involved in cell wall biosynthesis
MKKISILIPCYNEEEGIRRVIRAFPKSLLQSYGYRVVVIVIDNNSKDKTASVARRAGARVIFEGKQGKGNAIRTGMAMIDADTDYVVMLDGDDTYRPEELMRLVEPLNSNFCDVVIGSRLGGRIPEGAMKGFNLMGNWVFSHMVRYFYHVNVTDVLTGYFAWKKPVVDELWPLLVSDGFAIEMEMITKMARLGHEIYSVPISYNPRAGESSLRPIYDGWRILRMYTRNLRWKPSTEAIELDYVGDSRPRYRRYATTFGERIGMRGDR